MKRFITAVDDDDVSTCYWAVGETEIYHVAGVIGDPMVKIFEDANVCDEADNSWDIDECDEMDDVERDDVCGSSCVDGCDVNNHDAGSERSMWHTKKAVTK